MDIKFIADDKVNGVSVAAGTPCSLADAYAQTFIDKGTAIRSNRIDETAGSYPDLHKPGVAKPAAGAVPVFAGLSAGAAGLAAPGSSIQSGKFYSLVSPIFRLQATGVGTAAVTGKYADGSTQTLDPVSAGSVGWYGDDKLVAVSWSGPATLTVGVL